MEDELSLVFVRMRNMIELVCFRGVTYISREGGVAKFFLGGVAWWLVCLLQGRYRFVSRPGIL
jgi:hypothetical protein